MKKIVLILSIILTSHTFASDSPLDVPTLQAIGVTQYHEKAKEDVALVYNYKVINNSDYTLYLKNFTFSRFSNGDIREMYLRNTDLSTCKFASEGYEKPLNPKGQPGDQCSLVLASEVPLSPSPQETQFYAQMAVYFVSSHFSPLKTYFGVNMVG